MYLLQGKFPGSACSAKIADLNADGCLDVRDLSLLKQLLLY